MDARTLTLRELNRATLARQLLLPGERRPALVTAGGAGSRPAGGKGAAAAGGADAAATGGADAREAAAGAREAAALDALEQVAGLQAQAARAGYVGLWARVPDIRRDDLTRLLHRRLVVKATLMRGTIHLVTADDFLRLRPAVQPLLSRLAQSFIKQSGSDVTLERLRGEMQGFFAEERTVAELRAALDALHPGVKTDRLALAVLMELALVRAPDEGATWGFAAKPVFVDAETWLGRPVPAPAGPGELILRYLAAFGPATLADIRAWSGLSGLRREVEALRPRLAVFCSEQGAELLDVPGAPLPPPDGPAPPALVPEWDGVLLAHDDRSRIVPDEFREPVYSVLRRLIGPAALLDGFAAATWKLEREGGAATLAVAPLRTLSKREREALALPGERLALFMQPQAKGVAVRFDPA